MADAMLQGSHDERCLADRVSALVRQRSEQLVDEWHSRWPGKGADPGVAGTLDQTLLKQVVPMIEAVGRHVQRPALAAARESALVRSGDGSDALDDLSALIIQRMSQEVLRSGGAYSTQSVLVVFERLAEGLRTMTSSTRALCRERDEGGHRREVRRLADSGLLLRHELRSCLNSILMSAEVLARPELCDDLELRGRQLDGIRSAVAHAGDLLLEADADTAAPATLPRRQPVMVPLQAVFEALKTELEGRARAASVTLVFQECLPRWLVDAAVARLALSNLLVNAIKYADAAKPVRWVTVRVEPAEGEHPAMLVMDVADNGIGIPAELQQRVLLRGFRAHPQVADGAGLGLAFTREHLVQQGGSMHISSQEGVGTTVRVTLRALTGDREDAGA